jgi:hypothetical protein
MRQLQHMRHQLHKHRAGLQAVPLLQLQPTVTAPCNTGGSFILQLHSNITPELQQETNGVNKREPRWRHVCARLHLRK